jgi:formyl-CoA transferase/CoA:oxalate CoA-transferase
MSVTGLPDGPPIRPGLPIADIGTGMFAAYGIAVALFERQRTGRGQLIDLALLDSVAALLTYQAGGFFATGISPHRRGNRHAAIAPYDVFAASDGDFMLAVGNDDQWRRCCSAIGLDQLAIDPRFATNRDRLERYDELCAILAERCRTESRQTWLDRLAAAGVPAGLVRTIGEVFADPQLVERQMTVSVDHDRAGPVQVVASSIKLSATPTSVRSAPPTLGQHTDAVLQELLGIGHEKLAALEAAGVIRRSG